MQPLEDQSLAEDEIIELLLDDESEVAEEPAPQQSLPVEETNVAEDLDEDDLQKIAQKVIEDFESDLESRSDWEEKHAEWLEFYYQTDTAKNPPWDGASDESIPIMTEAVNQFQSRSYKAFFPNRYFLDAIPTGDSTPESRERGERIAAHMNFQLGNKDRSYKKNKNQMFMATALHGSDFTKTYFDHLKRRTVIERVRAQDLVVPYHVGPIAIEDLERKTHYKYMSVNKTRVLKNLGFFLDEAKPHSGDIEGPGQDVVDESSGVSSNEYQESERDAVILEQHCILDLDDDGVAEPYIVWVDYEGKKVLRIQIRYEVDEFGAPLKDKEPIEYFTHYQFLPNPDGFYGLGFGHLLANLNKAMNKQARMIIDAGEMSTTGNLTYLISEALGIEGDNFDLVMGKGIKIPRSVDDIRKHFTKLDFQGPSPVLQGTLAYMQDIAQRIASSSDILAGQPEKVYQPMTLLTMLEQGLQLYSSVQEFIGVSMEEELQKVYRLNAKYMTSEEYFFDNDEQIQVTPEDYKDDFRIVPVFDPKFSTRSQKLARAQAVYQFALSDPLAQQNPNSVWMAGKQYLAALDAENIDELYPEPQQPEIVRIDDQKMENAYFMMPVDKRPLFDVFPDQDHVTHVEDIDDLIQYLDTESPMDVPQIEGGDASISRFVATMSSEQKEELVANLLRHRAQHLAFMYGQISGAMDEQGQPTGGGEAGQMAEVGGNDAGLEEIIQSLQAIPEFTDV